MNLALRSSARRVRQTILFGLINIGLIYGSSGAPAASSDYERDLANINRRLGEVVTTQTGTPNPSQTALLAEKAFLTESPTDLVEARDAVANLVAQANPASEFVALHAKLLLQLHEVKAAQKNVSWLETHAPHHRELTGLQTDLSIEAGNFAVAQTLCEAALRNVRDWPMLARLGQVNTLLGRSTEADALYVEAEDTLTAKQMKVFAWLEAQRGRTAATQGKWEKAERHYVRAEQAYSGLWSVLSCQAEAAGARGDYAAGVALYEELVERTGRPEFCQALGDLYLFSGNPVQAKIWHEQALVGFQASASRDEILYYHHLADFYANVRRDGAAAVTWARRDSELRPGPRTRQTLAWALYRAGAMSEALNEITAVLSSGLQNAHLFEQAARINAACGREAEAKRLLQKASSLNPNYTRFHVHF